MHAGVIVCAQALLESHDGLGKGIEVGGRRVWARAGLSQQD
ncbi:hypothetical protein [Devosia sp. DBB001]|nr:hypothetical protein [Devosia sp. DBB001]